MRLPILTITCAGALLAGACLLVLSAAAGGTMPRRNPSTFTAVQWTDAFTTAAALPLGQRVALWADLAAMDSVYVADPLGEGPDSTPDPDPLVDFVHVDCVTYVEQVYALALAPSRAEFDQTLQRIRYRDGQIGFRTRNHYFVADWLPANAWFLRDITEEIAPKRTVSMTKTIARQTFFTGKGITPDPPIPDETFTTTYIPRDRVQTVLPTLRAGDLVIFMIATPGIEAGHVGLLRLQGNTIVVQHAGLTAKAVVTQPLAAYLKAAPARFVGVKIARPFVPARFDTPVEIR